MALNFNVDPYYDDFDQEKNFHRILFKPGYAVQARELTQAQTILQDQITKFADNIFKQNSPVSGGQVTTNFNCHYIKLQPTYNNSAVDVAQFNGKLIQNATGEVIARVLATVASTGTNNATESPTLVVSYKSGVQFQDDDIVYDVNSNLAAQAIGLNSTGTSSVASISQGVFYVLGNFVQVPESTIVLDEYSSTPSKRVGLSITETIVDYINDSSLLDPAVGASNYQAPGADRYEIALTLSSRPLELGDDQNFIELVRITEGSVAKMVDGSVYNVIDDYFAKRDYETNGDYVVEDFKLTPKTNADASLYDISIGKGLAYVHGYRLENQSPITVTGNRARTTGTQNNNPIYVDFGSYIYVDNVSGDNGEFLDFTKHQTIDLHCVPSGNINLTSATTYNSTVVASGLIRGLVYDHSNSSSSNNYVYKAFVNELDAKTLSANAVSSTVNTITLPSTYSSYTDAYIGMAINITQGPSAGDFRTITSYDGSTKVATVNQNWTTTPTTDSTFTITMGVKDTESLVYATTGTPCVLKTTMRADYESRTTGTSSGDTVLENPTVPEMLFKVGSPYVASVSNVAYTTQQVWKNKSFTSSGGSVTTQLNYEGTYLDVIRHFGTGLTTLNSDLVKQNFTIIVTDKKTNTTINDGDIVDFTTAGRTITLDDDSSIATLSATDLSPFDAVIIAKVYVENGDNAGIILKYKNLIVGNTSTVTIGTPITASTYVDDNALTSSGQIYITNDGLVAPGNSQTLYLSDVKRVVKIIDTKSPSTAPTSAMLSNPLYDVSNNYVFDSGQRDSYYDHASITLKPGAPQPTGNLLVVVDYYQHAGGDGYFSLQSYITSTLQEDYQDIPQYVAKNGVVYNLSDSLDFRPVRANAQTAWTYRLSGTGGDNSGVITPVDLSLITNNYSYYLGRRDKLVLSKDRSFQLIEGAPSLTPLIPSHPDGSLVIANLVHTPYTGYLPTEVPTGRVSDLSIEKVKHKRYTMQDIAGIENRINQIEYYTSLSLLEQKASSLQISDAYGLNRFKNGILVDDFSSYSTADTMSSDYYATINRRDRVLTASQSVKNFPLKSSSLIANMGKLDDASIANLGYTVKTDGYNNFFSLPYTTANVISQKFASRTVNVNPFSVSVRDGIVNLSPNVDNWVDTDYAPSLLITDPNLQVFQSNGGEINTLTVGDWKTVPGTTTSSSSTTYTVGHGINPSPYGYVGYKTTTASTSSVSSQNNLLGAYDQLGNTYAMNNGYITDISVLPYMRPQQIAVRARGMLFNTTVKPYFDKTDITPYTRKANIIELTGVTGTFNENDVLGYLTGGVFTTTARVLGVYNYATSGKVRLYVAADATSSVYSTGTTLKSATFNASGVYVSSPASGTIASTQHYGGRIVTSDTTTKIRLSGLASTTDNYYNGNTIYFNAGTGQGSSATISDYFGANQTAVLSTSVATAAGDIYSIGTFKTDETGSMYCIFNLPANTFHNGQRVLRIDNAVNGNPGTETTYAEGTFYAEGLQTTQQRVDFGASPAGAKNVFTQTNYQSATSFVSSISPWDPVAQTFIVSKDNYPNGLFLNSAKFFFASKPTSDNSSVTLSIVGTQNGYPNGETLDHSIVTLYPNDINVSTTPQYLDPTTFTEFKFSAPVYIQPGVMYSFILKTSSKDYTLWSASNGDTAVASSTKNNPTDAIPSTITKIGSAPYVGALFISQNAQTWTADQNQSLMFVVDRCVFSTSARPTMQYVVPKKLPQRTLIEQSVEFFKNANTVSSSIDAISDTNVLVDAFNITTTDFTPTTTGVSYSYNATLTNGNAAGVTSVIPGKFGTPTSSDIYLNDGKGERVLDANTGTSFSLFAQLSTQDDAVSPIISDAGLSTYAIKWNINNCELSNSVLTLVSGGSSYNVVNTSVTISAPTGLNGVQAYATPVIVDGVIESIYFTNVGSGYIETPTVTIADANTEPGSGATAFITGETSVSGGNALTKYVTKKVVLDAGFDSGDLNVYLSAYRPVNTDINVYYKILNRSDTQSFDDGSWQLMTKINSSASSFSKTRDDIIEYSFAPGTAGVDQGYVSYTSTSGQIYNTFSQFAIKVVLSTADHTYVPFVTDLRAIALPSNTDTLV